MVILSHPTGNAFARAALRGLRERDLLRRFHTTVATFPGSALDRLGGFGPLSELRRRRFDADLAEVTRTHPLPELGRMLAPRVGLAGLTAHETGALSVDAVYRHVDAAVAKTLPAEARGGARAVYAYEDGARLQFARARELGLRRFYDLPIGYWRAANHYLGPAAERRPDYAATLEALGDSRQKLAYKDDEIADADRVFVASAFTAATLERFPGRLPPVTKVPYGFPAVGPARDYDYDPARRPLRLLFVGRLSQRKGIAEVFDCAAALGHAVELTVVGRRYDGGTCTALTAALSRCTHHESLDHAAVLAQMRAHDVLLFPSLFEGFGLVLTEAMSQGTPVITTDRTAGPDLLTDGREGWLVPPEDSHALTAAVQALVDHPERVGQAGAAAREAARRRPWSRYSDELAAAVAAAL